MLSYVMSSILSRSSIRVNLNPKMTWSIKGMCGVLCTGFTCLSLYSGYKKSYRGTAFCAVGAVVSGIAYSKLDKNDQRAQEVKYQHEEKIASIKHRSSNPRTTDEPLSVEDNTYSNDPQPETLNQICSKPHVDLPENRLIGDLIYKGDSILIYGADGVGKSVLAMQICIDIANGSATKLLPESDVCTTLTPQKVLYYDAEQNDADIHKRYAGEGNTYPDSLQRISHTFSSVEELFRDISRRVTDLATDVTICIDNLSAIIPNTSGKAAQDLFQRQKGIKDYAKQNGHTVTIIVIGHTGKDREDFYGSAHLGNLAATRIALKHSNLGGEFKVLNVEKNRKFKSGDAIVIKREQEPYLHFAFDKYAPYDNVCEQAAQVGKKAQVQESSGEQFKKKSNHQVLDPEIEAIIREDYEKMGEEKKNQAELSREISADIKKRTEKTYGERSVSNYINDNLKCKDNGQQ